jgi:flavodoxin
MKRFLLLTAMMTVITSGFAQKKLVLYYSETGSTKTVAEELQKQLNADIEAIEAVKPYSGNFQETMQRGQREMQSGETPALKHLKS